MTVSPYQPRINYKGVVIHTGPGDIFLAKAWIDGALVWVIDRTTHDLTEEKALDYLRRAKDTENK